MELPAFEEVYGEFYVPAFQVKVDGKDLVRELNFAVSNVEVGLTLNTMGRFNFTVANAFDLDARQFVSGPDETRVDLLDLFAFGATVEVRMGHGDFSSLRLLMTGIITEMGTKVSGDGVQELTVCGYDNLYKLGKQTCSRHWEKVSDSDVVIDLAGLNGITADAQPTQPIKPRVDKSHGETDLAFIDKLAKRNSAIYYLRDNRLKFGLRNNKRSEVLELNWGKGLLSFSPEASLAKQVSIVEINGWSVADAKPIVGRSNRGDETGRDSRRESGAERVAAALGFEPVLSLRQPVSSQAEADRRARAILEERAEEFLKGQGECIGLPEVLPDTNIALGDIGQLFSKTYYVKETTHKIDSNGYRTSFSAQETTL